MSMKLMVLAMELRVGNPLRKLVLLKLCDNANEKGECWPSIQHIADQCEISRRSVINHIQALRGEGFLTIVNRAREGEKISNLYVINLNPAAPVSADISAPKSGGGSAGDALGGSAGDALGSAGDALPPSAGDAHRTSHSSESVNEPNTKKNKQKKTRVDQGGLGGAPASPGSSARGSRLPVDWVLPDDWAADAAAIDPRLVPRVGVIAASFRDYWVSKPGAGGRKVEWRATWRNWLRREAERLPVLRSPPSGGAPVVGYVGRASPGGVSTRDRSLQQDLSDRSWADSTSR